MSKRVIDHKNNKFPSISKMCSYWGISKATYNERIKLGWSLKDAVTIKPNEKEHIGNSKRIIDHEGNEFPSIKEMCKHWKITLSMYNSRVNKCGWSLEKTLTTKPLYTRKSHKFDD